MSKHPVVVYGASGYTGRLICEYLRELGVPFTAAGRDQDRTAKAVASIGGIETVEHEVVAVEHTKEGLTELFDGAKVVCNTVGPFASLGMVCAEASLAVGAHYLDTTGEQNWMLDVESRLAGAYAEANLTLVPGLAHMYTVGEICAQVALEQPGLDTLDILVLWGGAPTTASTETIVTNLMSEAFRLEGNEYVSWGDAQGYEAQIPGQHELALTLPWGGTGHPVWFKDDHRVSACKALGGVFNRPLMETVLGVMKTVEKDIRPLPKEEQDKAIGAIAEQFAAPMPPRESPRTNRSVDSVHASGPLGTAHVWVRGNCNYKQTGLLQAWGALHCIQAAPLQVGLASGCQAFGHHALLGTLQAHGLTGALQVQRG